MLPLKDPGLPPETAQGLRKYQAEVDAAGAHARRVEEGSRLFKLYNQPGKPVFAAVRERLALMCSGNVRCAYCEDAGATDIEHFRPKSLYPERVFVWENYLYACSDCNRRKGPRFSVMVDGHPVAVKAPQPGVEGEPSPSGSPALIDPRSENPLDFLELDLQGSFRFLERENLPPADEARTAYTIRALSLNNTVLSTARKQAYGNYRARLGEYRNKRDDHMCKTKLDKLSAEIVASAHPTVWREMKRQRDLIDELTALFAAVPEALDW